MKSALPLRLISILAVLLLVGGCSKKDTGGPSSSVTPTPGANQFNVGADGVSTNEGDENVNGTDGTAGSGGATGSGGANNGSGSDKQPVTINDVDPNNPLSSVEIFLDAIRSENYGLQRELTRDAARTLVDIRAITALENQRRGGATKNTLTVKKAPRLDRADSTNATANLDVSIESTVSGDQGAKSTTDVIAGPLKLVRKDVWTITDFSYSGETLSSGYQAQASASNKQHGFRLRVNSVLSYKESSVALVELIAEDAEGEISVVDGSLFDTDGSSVSMRLVAFERGSHLGFISFSRVAHRATRLETKATLTKSSTDFTWVIGLR